MRISSKLLSFFLVICFVPYSSGQYTHSSSRPTLNHQNNRYTHQTRLLTSSLSFVDDTQTNTYFTGDQSASAVATLQGGGSVVVWHSSGQDGSGYGVYAQMFDASQAPSGSEFRVNTATANDQSSPDTCGLTNGRFVVVYQVSGGLDGSDWGVFMKILNTDSTTSLAETRVNEYTSADQSQCSVTCLPNGGFVVTWHSNGQDGSGYGVYAKVYNADASVKKAEFAVNTVTSGNQQVPAIAAAADSSFMITWKDASSGNLDVRGRIFGADGTAKTAADFVVNTYTTNDQTDPAVAGFPDNTFVVAWSSAGQEGYTAGIYFQKISSSGTKISSETRANTYTSAACSTPSIAALSNTGFLITWHVSTEDGSGLGVYAQRYNSDATKKGAEFRVNTYTTSDQANVAARAFGSTGYIITWRSYGQDTSDNGVFASVFLDCDASKYMYGQTQCVATCPAQYYSSSFNYRCLGKYI